MENMERSSLVNQLKKDNKFDVIVIGGGASGLGTAYDCATRGYRTLLVERSDFAKVTSSKTTKLIHGGVRYLAQGNLKLVHKALLERQHLYDNAQHIVRDISFIIPCYNYLEIPYYFIGLKVYDALAGFKKQYASRILNKKTTIEDFELTKQEGLKGAVLYHDGAFDDSRLAVYLAQSAISNGAVAINYMEAQGFIKEKNKVIGLNLHNVEDRENLQAFAPCIINATGVFVDEIRKLDDKKSEHLVKPSQGVHLILKNNGYNIKHAMVVPKTKDGRLLFVVPWYDHLILGTTDTMVDHITENAVALQQEVDFILETANGYFKHPINPKDIISVYAGQRPLIDNKDRSATKSLPRDEKVVISNSNLITVAGGKWTTHRAMAEHIVDFAISKKLLKPAECMTQQLKIYGYTDNPEILSLPHHFRVYGSLYNDLKNTDGFDELLHKDLPYTKAHLIYAIENECARTIDDLLSRRTRCLFINAKATIDIIPQTAELLATKLNKNNTWKQNQIKQFTKLASTYLIENYT